MPAATSARPSVGYWLVFKPSQPYELRVKSVEVSPEFDPKPEDGFLFVDEDASTITGVRRLYQEWRLGDDRVFSFDRSSDFKPVPLSRIEKDILTSKESGVFRAISPSSFDKILSEGGSKDFRFLEEPSSKDPKWQEFVRELLDRAVALDLLGPACGPEEEIVGTSVRDRYLVGKIAPHTTNDDEQDGVSSFEEEDLNDEEKREKQKGGLILAANADHKIVDSSEASPDDEREDSAIDSTSHRSLIPSSFGLTFCVDSDVREIEVQVNWGRYDRRPSDYAIDSETQRPKLCWKRVPSGGVLRVVLPRKAKRLESFPIDSKVEDVWLEGSISEVVSPGAIEDGSRLVTFFLVNKQDPKKSDGSWLFQPEIVVRSPNGRAIFKRRPFSNKGANERDVELQTLDAIYRKNVEFAIGHGIAVHAEQSLESPERATEIRTVVIPRYELPATETPGGEEGDRAVLCEFLKKRSFDMRKLGNDSREDVLETLGKLVDDYERWIDAKEATVETPEFAPYREGAARTLESCRANQRLLQEGVRTLRDDRNAWDAFQFANRVMAEQRVHYQFATRRKEDERLEDYDKPNNRSWRPFQLAFILLTIPSLVNPLDPERSDFERARADLLWFPTGGGKTEAYMGVAAFAMAIRRLQGDLGGLDASRGLTVIMRYTLRLLTLQQFQRASTLTCALELERIKNERKWGKESFSLGLWVGLKTTPNSTDESAKAIERERNNRYGGSVASSPAQLQRCPWCGAEIRAGRDVEVDDDEQRTKIYCGDGRGKCPFSHAKSKLGLPVVVVDEEIYRRPPSMLIATVDKFAQLAWKGEARTLFGKANRECPRHGLLWKGAKCKESHPASKGFPSVKMKEVKAIRPPDLIIQDEFHLIGGALGTTVALYESAIDELCSWDWNGAKVRPKVVASTATTRKADEQTQKVFWRKVNIFPPSGSEIDDNYFSVQRTDRPGRRYVGICAPGYSRPAAMIRLYVAILTAAQSLFDKFGALADPYMTLVGYFNSLRELGGMRRLAEDDVQSRSFRVANDAETPRPGLAQRKARNVDELTSRVRSKDIPKKLEVLEQPFTKETKGGKTSQHGLDVALATNMLSVGVDVPRLGVMVVNGQPKNTAEYIQATSRVGRACPGLVFTALAWTRPRDFSHYESFEHFHATFYKFVEAQSATPFAARALDRCLTGALVSLARDGVDELNANGDAENFEFQRVREKLEALSEVVARRARAVSGEDAEDFVRKTLANRAARWEQEARVPGRKLAYERVNKQGEITNLLKRPSADPWDELTVATSMREVEPELTLVAYKLPKSYDANQPQWDFPKQRTNEQTSEGEEK